MTVPVGDGVPMGHGVSTDNCPHMSWCPHGWWPHGRLLQRVVVAPWVVVAP